MTRVERNIYINASWEAVDAIALDGQRIPEWFAGVQQSEPDGVYPQPGGSVKLTYKAAGVTFNLTQTVLELVPGEHSLYQLEGMITGTTRWTHTPEGSGSWMTAVFEYDVPGGGLGQALDRLLLERMNTENLEKSLENLKRLVEG